MEGDSPARQILGRALNELVDRHARVQPVVTKAQEELGEATRFIKALEKALGVKATKPARVLSAAGSPTPRAPREPGISPRERFTKNLIGFLTDTSGKTRQQIADHFQCDNHWLISVLDKAIERGQLTVDTDGRYQTVRV